MRGRFFSIFVLSIFFYTTVASAEEIRPAPLGELSRNPLQYYYAPQHYFTKNYDYARLDNINFWLRTRQYRKILANYYEHGSYYDVSFLFVAKAMYALNMRMPAWYLATYTLRYPDSFGLIPPIPNMHVDKCSKIKSEKDMCFGMNPITELKELRREIEDNLGSLIFSEEAYKINLIYQKYVNNYFDYILEYYGFEKGQDGLQAFCEYFQKSDIDCHLLIISLIDETNILIR
ncbi:hypothetical protein [Tistrella mobilis]|uniref:hypothetical protein n=1 Tax=Tistrella mobilis TaxID=171437 RepID=UPI0011AE4F27|nr:hypothetical protein [Tistrella mobilis]